MAKLDKQVLDGFSYTITEATLWRADKGVGDPVVILTFTDAERGIELECYFSPKDWEEFNRVVNGGVIVPSPEALRKLGV